MRGNVSNSMDLPETHGIPPAFILLAPDPCSCYSREKKGEGSECISAPETLRESNKVLRLIRVRREGYVCPSPMLWPGRKCRPRAGAQGAG